MMKTSLLTSAVLGLGLAVAAVQGADAATQTWGFASGTSNPNALGNVQTYTSAADGWIVNGTAWTWTGSSIVTFEKAALNQFNGYGLGVCESASGCSSPNHSVDNYGLYDFVLLSFDRSVTNLAVTLTGIGYDTDVTYFVGTLAGGIPFDIDALTPNALDAIAGVDKYSDNGGVVNFPNTRTINITGSGNFLLLGASITMASDGYDKFKLRSVSAVSDIPEPTTWTLMILGFAGLAYSRRRSLVRT